ncbi:ComEC family competence protein [bacterium]|nr:ComEC family competence protein [bacterium]
MNRGLPLVAFLGLCAGVAFRSFFDFGFAFPLFLFTLAVCLFLFGYFRGFIRAGAAMAVFLVAAGLGIVRADLSFIESGDPNLQKKVGSSIAAEALVIEEPDIREDHTKLTVFLETVREPDGEMSVQGKALITASHYPAYHYGDRIRVSGEFFRPKNFSDENDAREFDYAAYLAKDGIFYQIFYPQTELVSEGGGNAIKRNLLALKEAYLGNISETIPEPEASLGGGITVGAESGMGDDLEKKFRATGIIHIVVLSGYNVTIIAESLMRALSFAPRLAALSAGLGSVMLFVIMTGASATIVRAGIMAALVIVARHIGRPYAVTNALILAATAMLLHNPKLLIFDASFQLSFLATLALIYVAPLVEPYFRFITKKWNFREFAVATVATQIFVLPLLLYKIGELSLVALPVNLLVLISVPLAMLFVFLTGMAGFISPLLSIPFGFVAYGFLAYELGIVELFSKIPFASVTIPSFPLWALLLSYTVILYWILRTKKPEHSSGKTKTNN